MAITMPWDQVMGKFAAGSLKSGGKKVKSQKRALAIMYSEKRAAKYGKREYRSRSIATGGR